jgi:hypothetical protein
MADRMSWPTGLNIGSQEGTPAEFRASGSGAGKWTYLDDKKFKKVALPGYSPNIFAIFRKEIFFISDHMDCLFCGL